MLPSLVATATAAQNTTVGNILFVSISFLLLLVCVKKFAWGNIVKIFKDREERISSDLDSAEEARVNAQKLQSQRKKELNNARKDSIDIVNEAKAAAAKNSQQMIDATKEDIVRLKDKAAQDIEADKEKAYATVKNDVAAMSLQIASQILEKELDADTHEALINSCIEGLGKDHETK